MGNWEPVLRLYIFLGLSVWRAYWVWRYKDFYEAKGEAASFFKIGLLRRVYERFQLASGIVVLGQLAFVNFPGRLSLPLLPSLMIEISGLVIFSLGLGLAFWSRVALGGAWAPESFYRADVPYITSGPYKRLRHPMYLGVWLLLVGVEVALLSIFAVPAAIIYGFLFIWWIKGENRFLDGLNFSKGGAKHRGGRL